MSQAKYCELGHYCVVCVSDRDKGISSCCVLLQSKARKIHVKKTLEFYDISAASYISDVESLISRIVSFEATQLNSLEDDIFNELITRRAMPGCSIIEGFDVYSAARQDFIKANAVRERLFNFLHRFTISAPGITNENYKARREQGQRLWGFMLARVPPSAFTVVYVCLLVIL